MKAITSFWLLIACIGCSNSTPKSIIPAQDEAGSVINVFNLDTLKLLLNKNISEIKSFRYPDGVSLKDTVFESDDEAQWKGEVFYNKSDVLLFVETSWENASIVKRITVLSSHVVGMKGLKIGAKFIEIKSDLSQTIPSYPDGYFGLKVKNDNQVTCFFNISNNQNLGVGNVKFENIPEDIVVEQILIE
ncbi:MAG: hypothetical protein AB9842_06170 [Bacteroidales bacterium]